MAEIAPFLLKSVLCTAVIESSAYLCVPGYLLVSASEESVSFLSMTPNSFFNKHPAPPGSSSFQTLELDFTIRENNGALKIGKAMKTVFILLCGGYKLVSQ